MKSEDLIHILVRLTHRYYEFENEQTACTYEFDERKYQISFKRLKGKLESFTVEDIGEVIKCAS